MAKTEQIIDILRVDGIMAQGYGLNPKMVMRDKRLTPVAKCIYSYLASFAGGGNQAFPSRDIMMDELKISKDTYYKHLKHLLNADYIRIEQTKVGGGVFNRNIYTLVSLPNPIAKEEKKDNPLERRAESAEEKDHSAGSQKKAGVKKLQVKERASVNELRKQLEIDNLKLSDPNNADLIEDIFMAVDDMNSSEQISIGGNIKKKDAIQNLLKQLTADHIRLVVSIMLNNKKTLQNRKGYIQTCIVNSIFDVRIKNIEAEETIKAKQEQEATEKEQQEKATDEKQELLRTYEQYPELNEIDEKIMEQMKKLSRAFLGNDEVSIKKIQNQVEALQERRNTFIKSKGLKATI